jgi:large subunit ribosomal protein L6
MSRIGKLPIEVKSGVKVDIKGHDVTVTGAKGTLKAAFPKEITVSLEQNKVICKPANDSQRARAMWGLSRTMINNMVDGVSIGFTENLEIEGVGFRAAAQGKILKLNLGFSHDVNYKVPEGITIKTEKPTMINITGANKQLVGQVAAEIRRMKKPEPYKGKGIKYSGEKIRRKEGKKK